MHPNPAFRQSTTERNVAFARQRAFGTLAVNAADGPLLSHVPFVLNDDGASADLHLVRSNPIARLGETDAVIAVTGPDSYVSPDWYATPDQVPTWNYVAVHLRGRLVPLKQDRIRDMLDRQSAYFEDQLRPKPPWKTEKMSEETLARLMRTIRPFQLRISRVDGTWKLGQNKSESARLGAADHLSDAKFGHEVDRLAEMMRRA